MKLTNEQQTMLNGEQGQATKKAMEILLKFQDISIRFNRLNH